MPKDEPVATDDAKQGIEAGGIRFSHKRAVKSASDTFAFELKELLERPLRDLASLEFMADFHDPRDLMRRPLGDSEVQLAGLPPSDAFSNGLKGLEDKFSMKGNLLLLGDTIKGTDEIVVYSGNHIPPTPMDRTAIPDSAEAWNRIAARGFRSDIKDEAISKTGSLKRLVDSLHPDTPVFVNGAWTTMEEWRSSLRSLPAKSKKKEQ